MTFHCHVISYTTYLPENNFPSLLLVQLLYYFNSFFNNTLEYIENNVKLFLVINLWYYTRKAFEKRTELHSFMGRIGQSSVIFFTRLWLIFRDDVPLDCVNRFK